MCYKVVMESAIQICMIRLSRNTACFKGLQAMHDAPSLASGAVKSGELKTSAISSIHRIQLYSECNTSRLLICLVVSQTENKYEQNFFLGISSARLVSVSPSRRNQVIHCCKGFIKRLPPNP